MFRILRGSGGERVFRVTTISALLLLAVFFIGIIISMLAYTEWDTFVSALFSEEILFAIRLSVMTATIAAVISIIIAVPVAYAISRTNFFGKDIIDSLLDLPIVISPVALGPETTLKYLGMVYPAYLQVTSATLQASLKVGTSFSMPTRAI